jgi:hypothetical protein
MSQGFGVDIYGLPFYGYDQPADYSVAPFVAKQNGYDDITLSWGSPNTTSWKMLELVRSTTGYPNHPENGVVLTTIYPGTTVRTYDDPGLTTGVIYYYAMFITVEAPTWSSLSTYALNQQVLYNGNYWTSTTSGNINHTPSAGSSFWSPTSYIPTWYPAGFASTLALGNQGYDMRLYNRTPQPYKSSTSDTFSSVEIENQSLFNFESLFAYGLDILKAQYDSYLTLSDADTVSATNLDMLGQQLGIKTDYLSTPQQRRQRIKNAAVNYRIKGEPQSIHNLIAELAGWDSDITFGPNIYNSADQTAFVHPIYDTWSPNSTYFTGNLITYNGYNYTCTTQASGQAQAPTGTASNNTWWNVRQNVLDTQTLLNSETNQYSTWGWAGPLGTTGALEGIRTGLANPSDSTVHNWNALSIDQLTGYGNDIFINSTAPLFTPNWSSGSTYKINQIVFYTDGYYYIAMKPSGPGSVYGAQTPGVSQSFWKPIYYKPGDTPNIPRDGIPIPQLPVWNAGTQYHVGDQVTYQGIVYYCILDSIKTPPSGYYYSNANWVFLATSQQTIVSSSYWIQNANPGYTISASPLPIFYDKNGNQIGNPGSANTAMSIDPNLEGVFVRFVSDYADLNGTTEAALTNAQADGAINTSTWLQGSTAGTVAGQWRSSYGMASTDPLKSGTITYCYLTVDVGSSAGRFAVTFDTDFTDTAHKTHGIVFAFQDQNNFWYATRTSLRQVSAGTDTLKKSWARLSNGDRMVVDVDVNTVTVYKYARDGKGTLSVLASFTGGPTDTGPGHLAGLIQKYSASGAL